MIVEFKDLFIDMAQNIEHYWAIKTEPRRCFDLGSYETLERNKEVLEEVLTAYQNGEVVFYMPEN